MRRFMRVALGGLMLVLTSGLVGAQSSSIGDRGSSTEGGASAGVAGGAAQADFGTLMNLIQQTVEPNGWVDQGGNSSMLAYPAGVFVDPKGQLRQVRDDLELIPPELTADNTAKHPWLAPSPLRIVSLKALDGAIAKAAIDGKAPTGELLHLAGLSRIEYVRVDAASEDILLAGPSGDPALGFHLEDIATVAALITSRTVPMGCSIEPTDSGLRAAQAYLKQPGVLKRLARSPKPIVAEIQARIGANNVRVFGMPARCTTAIALLDADAHMKQVGFGKAKIKTPLDNYFDHLDALPKVPAQSMVRWWFAYADKAVSRNREGDTFQLPEHCVRVMSEQQWMTANGRAATGGNDIAADNFAKGFTKKIDDLRSSHPSYGRLCAVFETALGLQVALDSTGQPNLRAWLPNLCALGVVQTDAVQEPKTVEGLTTSHRLSNGTVIAVVSGGVKLDVRSLTAADKLKVSKYLSESVVPPQSEPAASGQASFWWQ